MSEGEHKPSEAELEFTPTFSEHTPTFTEQTPTFSEHTPTFTGEPGPDAPEQAPDISGYSFKRKLGEGAFGTVWHAIREPSGLEVAIKILHQGRGGDRFRTEFARLRDLSDDHYVLGVLDASLDGEPPYFVTPFCACGSLAERARLGPETPSFEQRVGWFEQLAKALNDAHRRGFLHCDLKPPNVLLDSNEQVLLADFGQSLKVGESSGALGTLGYMPPEQALSLKEGTLPDVAWDVYAMGATVYALFTGQVPRLSRDDRKSLHQSGDLRKTLEDYAGLLRDQDLTPVRQLNPEVDPELAAVIERCLEIDPERRTDSVADVLEDLRRWRKGTALLCRRPWTLSYRAQTAWRLPAVRVGLALSLLLVVSVITYIYYLNEKNRQLLENRGLEAYNAQRLREAYLLWGRALQLRPGDTVLRIRLRDYPFRLKTLAKESSPVSAVAIQQDGGGFATGGSDGHVALWDADAGTMKTQASLGGRVLEIAFVADRVWARSQEQAFLWEPSSGREPTFYSLPPDSPRPSVSGDARWMALPSEGGLEVRETATGEVRAGQLNQAAFGPEGPWLLASDADGSFLMDLSRGQRISLNSPGPVVAQALALPVGEEEPWVVTADAGGQLYQWFRNEDGASADGFPLEVRRPGLQRLWFSPRGERLAVAYSVGDSVALEIVDVSGIYPPVGPLIHPPPEFQEVQQSLQENRARLATVTFPAPGRVLTRTEDGVLRLWNLDTAEQEPVPLQSGRLLALALDPQGAMLTGATDGTARLWQELVSRREQVSPLGVDRVAFGPSQGLAVSKQGGEVVLWTSWDLGEPPRIISHAKRLNGLIFSPRGERLATASRDTTAAVYDLGTKPPVWSHTHPAVVTSLAFDGNRVATGTANGEVGLWEVEGGGQGLQESLPGAVTALDLEAPSLVAGSQDGTVRVFGEGRPAEWKHPGPVRRVQLLDQGGLAVAAGSSVYLHSAGQDVELAHFGPVTDFAVSPDGQMLATGSEDATARVWSLPSGRPLTPPLRQPDTVQKVAFSPDGQWLASGGRDGSVIVWESSTGRQASPTLRRSGSIRGLSFEADQLLTVTSDGWLEWYPLQPALAGADELLRELEAYTGAELDATGSLHELSSERIRERLKGLHGALQESDTQRGANK